MVEWLLLAMAIGLGVDLWRIALLFGAIQFPWAAVAGVGVHLWRLRGRSKPGGVAFCEAVADELRSGATLRGALGQAARSVGEPDLATLIDAADYEEIAAAVAVRFPDVGTELKVSIERVGWTGAPSAGLFEEIGGLALAQDDVRREVKAALAPARATAVVLMSVPLVALWVMTASGTNHRYLEDAPQRLAVVVGSLLVAASFVVGGLMLKRSA